MSAAAIQAEALARATTGQSAANFGAIFLGFMERGIPEADIRPRENVLTFHAWLALGRHVRKGEHGIKVVTWIPVAGKVDPETGKVEGGGKRCKSAVVFHVSQTDPNDEGGAS